jgi:hypothetical protein
MQECQECRNARNAGMPGMQNQGMQNARAVVHFCMCILVLMTVQDWWPSRA